MKSLHRHRIPYVAIGVIFLGFLVSAGAFAGDDTNPAPQVSLDATLKSLPKDKAEAGKVIFEKIIAALGGRENLQKVRDSKLSVDYKVMPGNADLMAVYYMKLPDKLRIDLMNESWTRAFDGTAGWEYAPRYSFRKLTKEALADFKNSALAVQGMLYPENLNISPVLEGLAPIRGKNYLLISYANRHGYDSIYVHVDPVTFLPFVSTSIRANSKILVISSEYRELEGVKLPFSIEINLDGNKAIHMAVKEWKLNSNLDDALFVKKSVKAQIKKGQQIDLSGFSDTVPTPKAIYMVPPVYPQLALRSRVGGTVLLRVTIDEAGMVQNTMVIQGHPLLNGAAVEAVRQWKFRQTIQNGKPVQVTTKIPVLFKIP